MGKQPAEERGLGAMMMLRDRLFQRFPKPDFGLAIHVHGNIPPGVIRIAAGYVGASSDSVDIGGKIPSLHSSGYYPDAEQTLETAFMTSSAAMIELFRSDKWSAAKNGEQRGEPERE